jgi:putative flippase GtrA
VAVTASYVIAFALSFVLNRALNFKAHGHLGSQTAKFAVAVGVNYGIFVLGVGTGLTAVGTPYELARIVSGLCEGAFMYSVMRWVVFRAVPAAEVDSPSPGITADLDLATADAG